MTQDDDRTAGAGGRSVRLADIAARAGVSIKTVSRVVNDEPHVAAATRRLVEDAIAELGLRARPARGDASAGPASSGSCSPTCATTTSPR